MKGADAARGKSSPGYPQRGSLGTSARCRGRKEKRRRETGRNGKREGCNNDPVDLRRRPESGERKESGARDRARIHEWTRESPCRRRHASRCWSLVREGDTADTVDDFMTIAAGTSGIDPPLANIPPPSPPRRFLLFHVANPWQTRTFRIPIAPHHPALFLPLAIEEPLSARARERGLFGIADGKSDDKNTASVPATPGSSAGAEKIYVAGENGTDVLDNGPRRARIHARPSVLFIVTNKSHSALNGRLGSRASPSLFISLAALALFVRSALNARLLPKLRASSETNESVCDAKQTRQSRELMSESLAISSLPFIRHGKSLVVVFGLRSRTTTLPAYERPFHLQVRKFPATRARSNFPAELLILTRARIPSVVLADDAGKFPEEEPHVQPYEISALLESPPDCHSARLPALLSRIGNYNRTRCLSTKSSNR